MTANNVPLPAAGDELVPESLHGLADPEIAPVITMLMPPKIAAPLTDLERRGFLPDFDLRALAKAWLLSGRNPHLVAFASAYLLLRYRLGNNILDTIDMAWREKSRVNLSWSSDRWTAEHDRLARIASFRRISSTKTQYPLLDKYARLLPRSFPGYLIRNSTRLAAEGLRQRHCVATYHDLLLTGVAAIATVFLDRKRYTVQLLPADRSDGSTGNPTPEEARPDSSEYLELAPFVIDEVRGRFNKTPDHETLNRISTELDTPISPFLARTPRNRRGARTAQDIERSATALAIALLDIGVTSLRVEWCGSGDQGFISNTEIWNADGALPLNLPIRHPVMSNVYDHETSTWKQQTEIEDTTVGDAAEATLLQYIDATCPGLENCSGGQAEFSLKHNDGGEPTIHMRISENVTDEETIDEIGPTQIPNNRAAA